MYCGTYQTLDFNTQPAWNTHTSIIGRHSAQAEANVQTFQTQAQAVGSTVHPLLTRYMKPDWPDAVIILRDQAEVQLLCQMNCIAAQMNIPKGAQHNGDGDQMSGLARWYKLSLPIGFKLEDMILNGWTLIQSHGVGCWEGGLGQKV